MFVWEYSYLTEITKDGLAGCYGHGMEGVDCAVVDVFAGCWVDSLVSAVTISSGMGSLLLSRPRRILFGWCLGRLEEPSERQ